MNKKGSLLYDGLFVVITLLFIVIVAVILGIILDQYNTAFQAGVDIPDSAKKVVTTGEGIFPSIMDWLIPLFLFGLPLISLGLAYINNIPPSFFWIAIGVLGIMALLGFALSDLYNNANEDSVFNVQSARMPITNWVFTNYGFYSLFAFFVIAFGTFVKLRGDQYG